ncbi:hypothetical protein DL93DRAFT_2071715 [Clavulina sp. PMI_390]|nr:hypothetical protein DL93DRAFT_2071715 [Clavulina sp. PMI_390]
MSWNNQGYPGQGHHHQHHQHHQNSMGGFGGVPNYGPPSGPPPGWNGGYAPPSGPPPMQSPPVGGWNNGPPSNNPYQQGQGGFVNPGGYYHAPQPQPEGPAHMPPQQMQYYGPQVQNGAFGEQAQPYFQYSMCNGRKKALCIGVNYIGTSSELRGCINDARNVCAFLIRNYGYKEDDIVMLTDDAPNPQQKPTKANILRAMQWLVNNAQPNDSLFFHYSGHGGQTKDLDGDEQDGYDEVIYPLDFETEGHIVDDDMHFIMVKPLPTGCRLTSCHSGSALGKIKEPNLLAEAGQGLLTSGMSYLKGDKMGALKGIFNVVKQAAGSGNASKAEQYSRQTRTSSADVIMWSGCKDDQTSADTQEAGQATGAMSYAFIEALSSGGQQTYQQLLISIRGILKSKYSQIPQLSSSHPMVSSSAFLDHK